jgi:hypothetical protein
MILESDWNVNSFKLLLVIKLLKIHQILYNLLEILREKI